MRCIVLLGMLLAAQVGWGQTRPAASPAAPFEGVITYRVTWSGPMATEYGRLLPSRLRLSFAGRRVLAHTSGGLYPSTTLIDGDSTTEKGWAWVIDSAAHTAWRMAAPSVQPRVKVLPTGESAVIAGQACTRQTLVFTWPDPTPHLPKPEDYKPTQLIEQVWVSRLRHGLSGSAYATAGLFPLGGLAGIPLKVSGYAGVDRQLSFTLTAVRVERRALLSAEISLSDSLTRRPLDPRGPIPGYVGLVGVSPFGK